MKLYYELQQGLKQQNSSRHTYLSFCHATHQRTFTQIKRVNSKKLQRRICWSIIYNLANNKIPNVNYNAQCQQFSEAGGTGAPPFDSKYRALKYQALSHTNRHVILVLLLHNLFLHFARNKCGTVLKDTTASNPGV